jgi:hypothetical protein
MLTVVVTFPCLKLYSVQYRSYLHPSAYFPVLRRLQSNLCPLRQLVDSLLRLSIPSPFFVQVLQRGSHCGRSAAVALDLLSLEFDVIADALGPGVDGDCFALHF